MAKDKVPGIGSGHEKVTRLVDLSAIEAEAAAWVARLDAADDDAALRAEFTHWQATSVHHRDAAARLTGLWADMNLLAQLAPAVAPQEPMRLQQRVPQTQGWRRKIRPWAGLSGLAAVAAMLVMVMSISPGLRESWTAAFLGVQTKVYDTGVGGQRTIALEDGSSVQLNTDSRLEVRYSGAARDLWLRRGEAFFEVAPDRARPFSVYGADGVARAVGTAFVVRLRAAGMDVTVTKGIVEVAGIDGAQSTLKTLAQAPRIAPALVSAENGQVMTAMITAEGITRSKVSAADAARQLAWRQGMLAFSGDRLRNVVADVSRYTDIHIEIADPALDDLQVSGYFKVGDVEPMLEALEASFDVRVERVDDTHVRLRGRS